MSAQIDKTLANKLERLTEYLQADPRNLALLSDMAEAAYAAGKPDTARQMLDRYGEIADLPPQLVNLGGLLALAGDHYAEAAKHFSTLRQRGFDEAGIRFNLAWSHSMLGDFTRCAGLLDDGAISVSPRGPMLKVQALHHLGDLDQALEEGKRLLVLFPHDEALLGALSNLAMDSDDPVSARQWALAAPTDHQALAVLGMLALEDQNNDAAEDYFKKALSLQPASPRAIIGKGLLQLSLGRYEQAADLLARGSSRFGNHLGSWIASGWAALLAGNRENARKAFEQALEIDATFSEGHGGLAVLALLSGDTEEALRLTEVALRLDRQSLGGTLARILHLQNSGKPELANKAMTEALTAFLRKNQGSMTRPLQKIIWNGKNDG